jgi:hypothetical protein
MHELEAGEKKEMKKRIIWEIGNRGSNGVGLLLL